MKIGEFASLHGVSTKMLRHYDAIGLLKPAACDPENGYRVYTDDQSDHIKWIVLLKNLSFTLAEIKAILSGPVDSAVLMSSLVEKKITITKALNEALNQRMQIDRLLQLIQQEGFQMNRTIDLMALNQDTLDDIKKNIPNYDTLLSEAKNILTSTANGTTFGFIRLDLKQFKAINDTCGYEVGDRVIVALYQTLVEVTTSFDIHSQVARAGGDEFVVFVETKNNALDLFAEALKTAVNQIDYVGIGCHKPIDIYMGGIQATYGENMHLREIADFAYANMNKAREEVGAGRSDMWLVKHASMCQC